jgi:hypothetical protein
VVAGVGLEGEQPVHVALAEDALIADKSNEIPAAQALLAELGGAEGAIVTLDAPHRQRNISRPRPSSP